MIEREVDAIETVSGSTISYMVWSNYVRNLVNRFFKILPIREGGEKDTLRTYMISLRNELAGCSEFVVLIHDDAMFLSLLSVLQNLIDHPGSSVSTFRREVFNAISICNKLRDRYCVKDGEG